MQVDTIGGIYMDTQKLKAISASEAVWLAVSLCGKRRRALEEELELVAGQIDRWTSRKESQTPALGILPELIEATATSETLAEHVIMQWIAARIDDRNLCHETPGMEPCQLVGQIASLGAEFGRVAIAAEEAMRDKTINRKEAMRIKNAAADVIARCQSVIMGMEGYI